VNWLTARGRAPQFVVRLGARRVESNATTEIGARAAPSLSYSPRAHSPRGVLRQGHAFAWWRAWIVGPVIFTELRLSAHIIANTCHHLISNTLNHEWHLGTILVTGGGGFLGGFREANASHSLEIPSSSH